MTKFKFSLALLTSVFSVIIFSSSLQAACVTGDCAALGYTKSESMCSSNFIRCPFDTSKVFCSEKSVKIGDILYSDMTTSDSVIDGKIAIGIVFDNNRKLAVAITARKTMKWSEDEFSVYGLKSYGDNTKNNDYSGKDNTKIIIEECQDENQSCPAAEYAYNYSTAGTSPHDWFLPGAGEIQELTNYISIINDRLEELGTETIHDAIWTSTQQNYKNAYAISISYLNSFGQYWKTGNCAVYPVIKF